jgi:hypothetical protein
MRLAPQTSGVNRRLPSRLGRGGINPQKQDCFNTCEQQFGVCDVSCGEIYEHDDPGYYDCRHGCTIGFDICLAICELQDGPF